MNPFSDYGSIVAGSRFLGRKDQLSEIQGRSVISKNPGSIAIIGETRVGKSSLAYEATISKKPYLLSNKIIPIWINLSLFNQSSNFFDELVHQAINELELLDWLNTSISHAAIEAKKEYVSWSSKFRAIKRFFSEALISGIKFIFVLDEFDHARFIFKEDRLGFQSLRELCYQPECRITLITTSRRSIYDIEIETRAISTLDGIFLKQYVAPFNSEDMKLVFQNLAKYVTLNNDDMKELYFYSGGHPYLLDMIAYQLVFRQSEQAIVNITIDDLVKQIDHSIISYYERLTGNLESDGRLNKLLQILFGPVHDVNQSDVNEFMHYGLINKADDGHYAAFSGHFQSYLLLLQRTIDLWPLWKHMEIKLRGLILNVLANNYGDNCLEKFAKAKNKLSDMFDRCRLMQAKEMELWGDRASINILDFTYPRDLFDIMFADWQLFQPILGKDKTYWDERAKLLSKVRNPLAHNRESVLLTHEKDEAEGYCNEILHNIEEYNKMINSLPFDEDANI